MAKYIVIQGIRIAKDFIPETFGRLTTLGPKFLLPAGSKGYSRLARLSVAHHTVNRAYHTRPGAYHITLQAYLLVSQTKNRLWQIWHE